VADAAPDGARPPTADPPTANPASTVADGGPAREEPAAGKLIVGEPAGGEPAVGEPAAGKPAVGIPSPAGRRRIGLLATVAVLVLAADMLSKMVVVATLSDRPPARLLGGLVYLIEARNAGAAFSFAQGATVLFTAIAALVIVVILRSASQLRSLPWAVCLGLILGGAAGNLSDRLFRSPGPLRGRVVDWISVFDPGGRVWPVFNLADSAIVVGGVLAVLLAFAGFELTGTRNRRSR
jgi:signal peptidase II